MTLTAFETTSRGRFWPCGPPWAWLSRDMLRAKHNGMRRRTASDQISKLRHYRWPRRLTVPEAAPYAWAAHGARNSVSVVAAAKRLEDAVARLEAEMKQRANAGAPAAAEVDSLRSELVRVTAERDSVRHAATAAGGRIDGSLQALERILATRDG